MVRVLVLAAPCLAPLLSGCDLESYPAELTYTPRTDLIVTKVPGNTPWDTTRPGQLDNNIARIKEAGGDTLDPRDMTAKDRQELDSALNSLFGSPAAPKVTVEDSELGQQAKELKLDGATLKEGSKVYRRHCMHCHGVTGDGRGPTGPWVNPHPRDYRQGRFKFISSDASGQKPRREDIRRILEHGIEGTSMPSFGLLEENQKEQLISYVIHLSLRGQAELEIMSSILKKSGMEGSITDNVKDQIGTLVRQWVAASQKGIEPSVYPYKDGDKKQLDDSVRRGFELFTDPKGSGSCIGCHLDFGRQAPFRYDEWGSLVRPANLTAGVYRGGRRPIDFYWRIKGGIPPSGMSRADLKIDKEKKVDEYWDVVNFLQALPYPQMLPQDVRERIYPQQQKSPPTHAAR
jgi:mono/diheme cytochrome c family protein